MSEELCPLVLQARLVPKLWGGARLAAWGKVLPAAGGIGESWELYDDEAGSVRVAAGPAAGRDLRGLARDWGARLLGPALAAQGGAFPVLVKLLDAGQDLSVQVHPDDALARELHGPAARGKSELWVVLEAAEGACVYSGFKAGTDRAAFEAALAGGTVAGLLRRVPVNAGDVIEIPAGRVHAVGAGCLLAEVQQNSDHTYRVWDHGRLEAGKPRELHLDAARRALRFDAVGCDSGRLTPAKRSEAWGGREVLAEHRHFKVERWSLDAALELPAGRPVPGAVLVTAGGLRIAANGARFDLERGACVLVPADLAARLEPRDPGAGLLWIRP